MNYFSTQPINWSLWTPQDIIFKSNQTIKKLMPSENILSYKSKNDRDTQMCKLTGEGEDVKLLVIGTRED